MTPTAGVWTNLKAINTPKGAYLPKSDDLKKEIMSAAEYAGLSNFRVRINGLQIDSAEQLPCDSIKALIHTVTIEGVEPTVAVERYDKAGC